jgi:alkanesulfonate monooxygenase SsuD/methylene tetrahydromethanopterin reductase-like flavin-dependent oxidoreductase (luciferase family)
MASVWLPRLMGIDALTALAVVGPLIHGQQVHFEGSTVTARPMAPIAVAGAEPCPILVAALAPVMLKVAGELADGTVTWMVGAKTLSSHIVPSMADVARQSG